MRPESRKYLWDALQAADRIVRFTSGKSLAAYESDKLLRSAVERQFEIIGQPCVTSADTDPGIQRRFRAHHRVPEYSDSRLRHGG